MPFITVDDLRPFMDIDYEQAQAMVEDAVAMATAVAPCLADEAFEHRGAAKAIVRRAILRWNAAGVSGTVTQQSAGPFSETVSGGSSKGLFWPSEIADLQALCRKAGTAGGGAFTIKPAAAQGAGVHSEMCDLAFFGTHCTCGSNLNRGEGPIFNEGRP